MRRGMVWMFIEVVSLRVAVVMRWHAACHGTARALRCVLSLLVSLPILQYNVVPRAGVHVRSIAMRMGACWEKSCNY